METNDHLKFILKLLGCKNYRSRLSASAFNSFKNKNKICQDLGDRELIDYTREIGSTRILPAGQALLKLDIAELPIKDKELKVLKRIGQASGAITPGQIKISSLRTHRRDAILKSLNEKGLIEVETKVKRQRAEVWLTERGIKYLRDDYNPHKGNSPVVSLDLLNNYLRFLRKTLSVKPISEDISASLTSISSNSTISNSTSSNSTSPNSQSLVQDSTAKKVTDISDEEILQTIQDLDRELGTENYLPIFHLREKLQPPLSREQLDKALYRLQGNDRIDFSTLQEANAYTPEQINTGISQNVGGPLFFISIN